MTTLSKDLDTLHGIEKLLAVVSQLRNPETGCPWDLKQTHTSLKPYLLEESYEVLDAIDQDTAANRPDLIKEELGDLLLQIALHAQIGEDNQRFNFADVAEGIAEKLIRRHPHVFGDVDVADAEEVTRNWEAIKQQEKAAKQGPTSPSDSILDTVPAGLPALVRGTQLSKKAVKVGFKWPNDESLWECVMSEFEEFRAETKAEKRDPAKLEDEMGDIFFASVSLANHYKVDPETALARANAKFTRRFQAMEKFARKQLADKPLEAISFEEWDDLWKQAKASLVDG